MITPRWPLLAWLALSACTVDSRIGAFTSPPQWVTAGYEAWQRNLCPPTKVDFSAITHLVVRGWASQANGELDYGPDLDRTLALDLSSRAHAAERQILMSLGDYSGFASAVSAANRATFVSNVLAALSDLQYHGVDLFVGNASEDDFAALAEALRAARPEMVITISAGWSDGRAPLGARLASTVDQINIGTFEMAVATSGWVSWHFSPLEGQGPGHPSSVISAVTQYTDAGIPKVKLGIGVRFAGQAWSLPVIGPLQSIGQGTIVNTPTYAEILQNFYQAPGVIRGFSDAAAGEGQHAKMAWLSFPSGHTPPGSTTAISWISYEDPASIAAKGAWSRAQGLGGVMVWRLAEGVADPISGANPLLESVKDAFLY